MWEARAARKRLRQSVGYASLVSIKEIARRDCALYLTLSAIIDTRDSLFSVSCRLRSKHVPRPVRFVQMNRLHIIAAMVMAISFLSLVEGYPRERVGKSMCAIGSSRISHLFSHRRNCFNDGCWICWSKRTDAVCSTSARKNRRRKSSAATTTRRDSDERVSRLF